jgi:HEAT repeat protein
LDRVVKLMLQPAGKMGEQEIVRALGKLGQDAVPILLSCASGDASEFLTPALIGDGRGFAVRPDRIALVAEEALGTMPCTPVLAALSARLQADDSLESRATAARILGHLGATEGLDLAFVLLRGASNAELRAPYVREPMRSAFAAPLRAQAGALARLETRLRDLDTARLLVVLEALEASGRGDAARLLAELARSTPAVAPEALGALGSVAAERPFEAAAVVDLDGVLAPALVDKRADVRAAAAQAAGRAQVADVAWALIDRLDDAAPEVRAAARTALRRMAGVDHGYDMGAWSLLAEAERRWREGEGMELALAEVAGEDLSQAARALRGLAAHGLSRGAIGAALGALLPQLPTATARTAAATLTNLDTRAAVPGLVALCDKARDAETLAAAHAALAKLTGRDLPADPDAWQAWLERSGSR